jgi:predicted TIM-barrel fold metal-dependent hydrolase
LKILREFKNLTVVQIHNGESCLPWEDNWMVIFPKLKYPELLSFAKKKKEKRKKE